MIEVALSFQNVLVGMCQQMQLTTDHCRRLSEMYPNGGDGWRSLTNAEQAEALKIITDLQGK